MNAISVGIDISKGKSMVAAIRPLGETVVKPREFLHTAEGLGNLAGFLKTLDGEVRVVMEATGRYHEPVAESLHQAGFFVAVINPKLIKDYGNNSLRKVKTDKADARKIARYGLERWGELRAYTPEDSLRVKLKEFSRQYNLYIKTKTALKNNLIALIDQTFPDANALFNSPAKPDGHQKWVDFVATFWHRDCVCGFKESAFAERYAKWCKRNHYNFSESKAAAVYAAANSCHATLPKDDTTKLLITEAASQLATVSKTVEIFRAEMLNLASTLPEFATVMNIYGVGNAIGPQLMAEIGDVRRFSSRKSLVAFAGIDPGDNSSGTHQAKSVPTSKRGSPSLRKSLFLAVSTYLKHSPADEPVYQFLSRKRAEGKPFYVYMTAAANKFLRIYYARVREHLNATEEADS